MMTDGIPDTKLMFKYVEVGRFDKTDEELTSLSDKWMYVLKNLSRLDNRPPDFVIAYPKNLRQRV